MRRGLLAFLVLGLASCSSLTDLHGIRGSGERLVVPSSTTEPVESGVAESRHRFRAARERLLSSPDTTIEFRYDVRMDGETQSRTQGTADLARLAWATETVVKAPGRDKPYVWHAVSSKGRTWMQMDDWKPPAGGCWLQIGPEEVPLGVTGLLPGIPAYTALPKVIRVAGYLDSKAALRATLRLDLAATMLPSQLLQKLKGVTRKRARDEDVGLVVHLDGSRLEGYEMEGASFRRAWAYAGGNITPEAAQALTGVEFRVRFPEDQAPREVRMPEARRVFTKGEDGCGVAG